MVAIYWNPEAYDTTGKRLMGRHAAGEGFIRGYIRHASAPEITLWNAVPQPSKDLEALVRKLQPTDKPIRWIERGDIQGLRRAGVINLPVPGLGQQAWSREMGDPRSHSVCGVTHTTITPRVLDILVDQTLSPTRPWDALVCTSRAVRASVDAQNEMVDAWLAERLGATRTPKPYYPVIPLGVNTEDFTSHPSSRREWREKLGIGDDDVAVLYVGRWNLVAKMNPVIMAMALERAAAGTDKTVHWILAGWAEDDKEQGYKDTVLAHLDKVKAHWVDGRPADARRSIWSSADIFISLSDNLQETYGLTPVEAMAAALPCVVTDWNGYKDTVRNGVDGFRIPTVAPPAGLGRDLAFAFSQDWMGYEPFVASASQFTAVDLEATARALLDLIDNPDLRRSMGAAAQLHARNTFDWGKVIPQYEALWNELEARRLVAPAEPAKARNAGDNPWRPDPFRMYGGYPTSWLTATSMIAAAPGMTWDVAAALMNKPLVRLMPQYLPHPEEVKRVLEALDRAPQMTLGELLGRFPPGRRPFLERGVLWMAKYGMLQLLDRPTILNM